MRERHAALGKIDERVHLVIAQRHGRQRFGQQRRVDATTDDSREARRIAARLNDRHILGVDVELFQGQLGGVIRRRPESADGDALALQVLCSFDVRSGHQLVGDKIDTAGDDRRVAALQIGGHRQGAGGKRRLSFIGQQRLHRHRAILDGEIFHVESVFLKNLFLIADPQHRMDRRAKTTADGAEASLRPGWRNRHAEKQHEQRYPHVSFHECPSMRLLAKRPCAISYDAFTPWSGCEQEGKRA